MPIFGTVTSFFKKIVFGIVGTILAIVLIAIAWSAAQAWAANGTEIANKGSNFVNETVDTGQGIGNSLLVFWNGLEF